MRFLSRFNIIEDGHTCVRAVRVPRWFKSIRPERAHGCDALDGTVSACFGPRHKKPSRRVHSQEKGQVA
jgi:hypothetical protein